MHAAKLPITGPCPIDLDAIGFDRTAKVAHCTHCAKNVTVLSNMTRGEAQAFLREHAGQSLCVSYARDAEGRIRFAPEAEPEAVVEPTLVPVSRLRARPSRRAGLAVALGVSAALAACTPHGEAPREVTPAVAKPKVERPTEPTTMGRMIRELVEPQEVPLAGEAMIPEEIVEGKMVVPDPSEMIDGEMVVPDPGALDEPCEKGKVEATEPMPSQPLSPLGPDRAPRTMTPL